MSKFKSYNSSKFFGHSLLMAGPPAPPRDVDLKHDHILHANADVCFDANASVKRSESLQIAPKTL